MSRRFKIGEKFIKKAHAGFVGESSLCIIPNVEENQSYDCPCFLCDDEYCREWPTVYALNESGNYAGMACHVSECQMEFIKNQKEQEETK